MGSCWRLWTRVPRTWSGDYVGLTPSARVRNLYPETPYLLFSSVWLVPSEISNIWIEGVALVNLWSFFFSSSCHIAWGQVHLSGLLLCVVLSENLWWYHIHVTAHPFSNPQGRHCLVSPRRISGTLICNLIFVLCWSQVYFHCFVSFSCTELDSILHRAISILFPFFPLI